MTTTNRYRVTGAVFLVAIAVILLPMLFDGAGLQSPPMAPLETVDVEATDVPGPDLDRAGIAEADALRDAIDDDAFDRASGIRLGDPQLTDSAVSAQAPVEAWAVQLASFSDRAKALALRDTLHRDGYSALISEVKRVTGISTRVAVGPIIDRGEAERLSSELSIRYSSDAIVVRFDQ